MKRLLALLIVAVVVLGVTSAAFAEHGPIVPAMTKLTYVK